jgi:hypothetical protein
MKLVTVATASEFYFPWLKQSCERYNQELVVLGWGEKWQGFTWRFKLILDYIKSLPPDEIVCFIDGYDVILLRSLAELESTFKKIISYTDNKILIAYEDIKTLRNKISSMMLFGRCQDTAINAGTYIGYAKDLNNILTEMYNQDMVTDDSDDQQLFNQLCRKNIHKLMVDKDAVIFATIVDKNVSRHMTVDGDRVTHRDQQPFFLHAPALGCMNSIIKQLGYTLTHEDEERIKKYRYKSTMSKMQYYSRFTNKYYLLFVILLFFIIYKIARKRA